MKPQRFAVLPGLAVLIWAEYWDAITSRYYVLYTSGEANFWGRGEDGYYSLKKSMTMTAIVSVVGTVAAYTIPWEYAPLLVSGLFALAGLFIFFVIVRQNRKNLKEKRAGQFDYLENFTSVDVRSLEIFKGEWFVPTFYDIRTPILGPTNGIEGGPEAERAAGVLTEMFLVLKANPAIWWDLERARKVKEIMGRV